MLLEKCSQAPAVAVFAVVPHEVSAWIIAMAIGLRGQFAQRWHNVSLICEKLACDAGHHVMPAAQYVAIY